MIDSAKSHSSTAGQRRADDRTDSEGEDGSLTRIARRSVLVIAVACLGGLIFIAQAGAQGLGDASRGKDLFRGAESFENGGPPCMACHSAGGLGALGGGALGPDLTGAFDKWGREAGLLGADGSSGLLSQLPFATMEPIFGDNPLTADEQADIAAFLEESITAGRTSGAVVTLFVLGAAGALCLLALGGFTWRRHLNGVRKPMLARSAGS